jgi:hypothetical protein
MFKLTVDVGTEISARTQGHFFIIKRMQKLARIALATHVLQPIAADLRAPIHFHGAHRDLVRGITQ